MWSKIKGALPKIFETLAALGFIFLPIFMYLSCEKKAVDDALSETDVLYYYIDDNGILHDKRLCKELVFEDEMIIIKKEKCEEYMFEDTCCYCYSKRERDLDRMTNEMGD